MKSVASFVILVVVMGGPTGCSSGESSPKGNARAPQAKIAMQPETISIGGQPVVMLVRQRSTNDSAPQFLEATLAPGRGLNLLQLKAYLPGKGLENLMGSPSLTEAKQMLDGDDEFGNKSFAIGGALLLPYANRIRGTLSPDGKRIETNIAGKRISLPANWQGKNPGAEKHSMHGLILSSAFQNVTHQDGPTESRLTAALHAGNFGGHWPSLADVEAQVTFGNNAFEMIVTARNVGQEPLPMGIGFHPYFVFPSGNREQARLHLPSDERAIVDNYDNVFPTGKIAKVAGTPYDFRALGGAALGKLYLDDCFLGLKRDASGNAVMEVLDPAAKYGLRITAVSPEIKAIQIYAPPDRNLVALEPQFNLGDPYNKIWGKMDTGMVLLKPGESVSWHIRLELFTPPAKGAR